MAAGVESSTGKTADRRLMCNFLLPGFAMRKHMGTTLERNGRLAESRQHIENQSNRDRGFKPGDLSMTKPKDNATVPSVDSIVHRPWEYACNWYVAEDIHRALTRSEKDRMPGDLPAVPVDVYSREFAEWLTEQYRLAMRKGAEMATREIQVRIDDIFRR